MRVSLATSKVCKKWVLINLFFVVSAAFCARSENTNSAPLRYEEPRSLSGEIFAKGDRKAPLFKFRREASRSGNTLRVLREYSYPTGRIAAREHLVYEGDNLASYELEELQIGARGQAVVQSDAHNRAHQKLLFAYTESGGRAKTASETFQPNTVVNDMLAPFLLSHWNALLSGKEVKCRYIVAERRETVGFAFKKQFESVREGRPVILVKMEATSPIIAALVDPVFFTIEKDPPHRVLEYVGRTTPKIQSGGKWKDLDAVTVFDWQASLPKQ